MNLSIPGLLSANGGNVRRGSGMALESPVTRSRLTHNIAGAPNQFRRAHPADHMTSGNLGVLRISRS